MEFLGRRRGRSKRKLALFVPHELIASVRRDLTPADLQRVYMELRSDVASVRGGARTEGSR